MPFSRRKLLQGAGALGVVALLGGCLPKARGAQTYAVEMVDVFFDPIGLVLERGDTVVWLEASEKTEMRHTATAYHPDFDKRLRIPEAAPAWNSGVLPELGQPWSHTFEHAGVHDYFCTPHEDQGMVGRLLVETPSGPGAQPLDVGVSLAGQSVMPFVEELQGPVGEVFNVLGRLNATLLPWRRDDPGAALARWGELRREAEGLLPRFIQRLSATQTARVRDELGALDAALRGAPDVFHALEAVDAFKVMLEQLAYQTSGRRSARYAARNAVSSRLTR